MAEKRDPLDLSPAGVIRVLSKHFTTPFRLEGEGPGCFRLGCELPGLKFQWQRLPRAASEESEPGRWQRQQEEALEQGIRLVHIWEDQWRAQHHAVLSRIGAALGLSKKVHARETTVERVDSPESLDFLSNHHILVPLKGRYRLGLYRRNELLSLAVFSGPRQMPERGPEHRSYELIRFCHRSFCLVVGGLSKLLAAFAGRFAPGDIMTYIDLDWSDGHAFFRNGFRAGEKTPPQLFWISPAEGIRYYPHRLPEGLKGAGPAELHAAGYFRIYNCGSLKMLKDLV